MNYLAIDLGAESGRVILGSLENESIQLNEIHRFPNIPIRSGSQIHWNFDHLIEEVRTGIKKAESIGVPIESLSVDSWGVDYVLFDNIGNVLLPVYHYRDSRSKTGVERMRSFPWSSIFEETGIQFMPINTLYQLASEDPDRLREAEKLLGIADAIHAILGAESRSEISLASTFQLYNPRTKWWSKPLCKALSIDPVTFFGEVVASGTEIGFFHTSKIVASCSHDTGCAVAAVPAEGSNWAYLSSGTWSLMGVELAEPIINDKSQELNFTNEIGYGGSIRLLKNISGMWLLQECRRTWDQAGQNFDYAELTQLAQAEPACGSIIDPMDQRFLAPSNMPQAIAGYCQDKGQLAPSTPAQFTRCIFESLAQLYAKTLHQLEELTGQKIDRLHIVGGGSKNAFLNQLTTNACGIPVYAGPVEATALGNIIIQAITAGEIQNLKSARALIATNFPPRIFSPSG